MKKNNCHIQSIPNGRPLVLIYYLVYLPLAAYAFFRMTKDLQHPSWWLQMLILFGLLGIIVLFLSGRKWIRVAIRKNEQRARDQRAVRLLAWLSNHNELERPSPYTLYLRPFTSTGHIRIALGSTVLKRGIMAGPATGFSDPEFGSTTLYKRYVTFGDFETELADIVEKYAPLIALGKAGEQIGAGRIESEDNDWRAKFQLLAHHAKNIFLVPSTHEGTLWEIVSICSDITLLKKTILFIPPDDTVLGYEVGPFLKIGAGRGPIGAVDARKNAILALSQLVKNSSIPDFNKDKWGGLLQLTVQHCVKSYHALRMTKSPSFNPLNKGANLHVDCEHLLRTIRELMELDGY